MNLIFLIDEVDVVKLLNIISVIEAYGTSIHFI